MDTAEVRETQVCKLQASPQYTLLAFSRCKDFQEGYKNHGQKKTSSDCIDLYVTGAKWGKRGAGRKEERLLQQPS